MTAPGQAAQYFGWALLIGAALGLIYGFLRPLRIKCTAPADSIFIIAAFLGWIYLAFGICKCDIRLGYTLGLLMGGIVWEMTFGRLMRPVYQLFWNIFLWPMKKIFEISRKIYKFLLAILKKWVTILKTIWKVGGAAHGKKKPCQAGVQAHKPRDKGRHIGRSRAVSGGTGGTV